MQQSEDGANHSRPYFSLHFVVPQLKGGWLSLLAGPFSIQVEVWSAGPEMLAAMLEGMS